MLACPRTHRTRPSSRPIARSRRAHPDDRGGRAHRHRRSQWRGQVAARQAADARGSARWSPDDGQSTGARVRQRQLGRVRAAIAARHRVGRSASAVRRRQQRRAASRARPRCCPAFSRRTASCATARSPTRCADGAADALERMGASHLARRWLDELSSGEARRVLLARALVTSPRALVLDEPTTGLDLAARHDFMERVRQIARDGTTLILITHHIDEIVPEIERVVLLRRDASFRPVRRRRSSRRRAWSGLNAWSSRRDHIRNDVATTTRGSGDARALNRSSARFPIASSSSPSRITPVWPGRSRTTASPSKACLGAMPFCLAISEHDSGWAGPRRRAPIVGRSDRPCAPDFAERPARSASGRLAAKHCRARGQSMGPARWSLSTALTVCATASGPTARMDAVFDGHGDQPRRVCFRSARASCSCPPWLRITPSVRPRHDLISLAFCSGSIDEQQSRANSPSGSTARVAVAPDVFGDWSLSCPRSRPGEVISSRPFQTERRICRPRRCARRALRLCVGTPQGAD